ncbi:MAG TPA: peptidylprolyl isomerase [Vicinamibacterales bacterium]|jgi:peptidyl-prolyl cis-trans isomerase D
MTMLDKMRRHKGWLKWSLAIVVAAFIFLYIPSFLSSNPQGAAANGVVATVEGHDITAAQFRRVYEQQMQAYRASYGANVDERLLKQLGIDQRIVEQMIEEEASLAEAHRLGITASDAEVRDRILAMPAFQENGQFIGDARYREVLSMQNPPMRPDEFEGQIRDSIVVEKLQAVLTDWITVPNADVAREFTRRNQKVKLEVVAFPADKFRSGLSATDADVAKYFDDHKDAYRVPEKRKIRYLTINEQALEEHQTVTGQQIERYYTDNIQQFSTPEEVRASHILLKTDGKNDDDVKKQAEDILKRAKAGEDFAALAKKYSQDDGSAKKGGDLDFFPRGQMDPAFEKAAFALQPGQISDLVKSQFGFHIIKVTDKKAATTKSLADVRGQIEDQLKLQAAQAQAQKLADQVASELKKPADFENVARAHGLQTGESGFFQQDEPIAGIGMAPAVGQQAFQMNEGDVSRALRTPQGYAFIAVTGHQDPYIPTLDEVKAKVRDDALKQKAVEAARQKAASIDAAMKSGDFDKAAKAAGLDVKTTDLIARGAAIPDVGASPAVDDVAFALPQGGVSNPIVTDNGAAIIKVLQRKDATPTDLAAQQDSLRTELLNDRKNKFFSAYMSKARQRMKITVNREAIDQITA